MCLDLALTHVYLFPVQMVGGSKGRGKRQHLPSQNPKLNTSPDASLTFSL